jgi:hypothetical protein
MGTQVFDPADNESLVLPTVVWTAGLGTVALAGAALIGWAVDGEMLKRVVPGLVSMRPTTAVCLILLGLAVTTLIHRPRWRWVRPAATGGAGLIAAVALLEHALDRDLLSNRLLFRDAVARDDYGGRMALVTAVELVVMALALVAAFRGKRRAAQGLGLLVFAGGAIAVLGYAYGERRLYATEAQPGMAFNTALGLALVSLGMLAAIPNGVLTHLFRRPAPGALLSRRLLPWITIAMPVIGWLRVKGEHLGLFGTGLGTAIMVFAGSILVTAIAQLAAVSMDRLGFSLNHAWHQFGLASASQHSQNRQDQSEPPRPAAHDPIAIKDPPNPVLIKGHPNPNVIKDPSGPNVIKDPSGPNAIKDPSDPNAIKDPSDPNAIKDSLGPNVTKGLPDLNAMKDPPDLNAIKDVQDLTAIRLEQARQRAWLDI